MSSYRMTPRRGVTLLEVIVTIAILALVVGLLLSAVASVRMRATRADNENRLRQVTLAVHSYAEARSGNLPNVHGYAPDPGRTIFRTLAPYCEYQEGGIDAPALLRFPSDPSGQIMTSGVTGVQADFVTPIRSDVIRAGSSVGANAQVFVPGYKMPASIPDGLSNTIFFAEHYSVCGPSTFVWTLGQSWCSHEGQHVPCVGRAERHPTFAEASFSDVVPVTIGAGGAARTVGSLPLTFQVRPSLAECDPRVPNSSISGGLLVALADGSVRLVRRGIDPQAFWSAVTPAGGESVALD